MKEIKESSIVIRRLYLDESDLRELLLRAGHCAPGDKIEIYFSVPTGGDWSGQDVYISEMLPITVRVQRKEIAK